MKRRVALFATATLLAAPSAQADACLFEECWGGVGLSADYEGFWAYGHGTRTAVIDRALAHCDGDCLELKVFQNACGAIALKEPPEGDAVWSWSVQDTRFDAEIQALERCHDHGDAGTCDIVAWACSFSYP